MHFYLATEDRRRSDAFASKYTIQFVTSVTIFMNHDHIVLLSGVWGCCAHAYCTVVDVRSIACQDSMVSRLHGVKIPSTKRVQYTQQRAGRHETEYSTKQTSRNCLGTAFQNELRNTDYTYINI